MNCPQCGKTMVTARATKFGSEYQYCNVCKKELAEMVVEGTLMLPKGQMNHDLAISASSTRLEIEAARRLAKGDVVFVLDDESDDLSRLATDFHGFWEEL